MNRSIYLGTGTDFVIVTSPNGVIPPPLTGFQYLGDLGSIFAMLNYHLRQSDIAVLVGVKQQHISSYVTGKWEPTRLSEDRWRIVLSELRRVCLDRAEHPHDLETYRAEVLSPAHRKPKEEDAA